MVTVYTILWILLKPLNYFLKNGLNGNDCVTYILPQYISREWQFLQPYHRQIKPAMVIRIQALSAWRVYSLSMQLSYLWPKMAAPSPAIPSAIQQDGREEKGQGNSHLFKDSLEVQPSLCWVFLEDLGFLNMSHLATSVTWLCFPTKTLGPVGSVLDFCLHRWQSGVLRLRRNKSHFWLIWKSLGGRGVYTQFTSLSLSGVTGLSEKAVSGHFLPG